MPVAPFVYPRRVAFGECDPARIFYAPRAIDYSVEAAEAWTEAVLGTTWSDLARHGRAARIDAVDCEYQRSVVASQVVRVRVAVEEVGEGALALRAVGEIDPGERCFDTRLELSLVDRAHGNRIPFPAGARERIEEQRAAAAGEEAGAGPRHPATPLPAARLPRAAGGAPFTRLHRVRYGECSAAGLAYPPRLVDCAVEAAGEWYERCLGVTWLEQCHRRKGTPFVRIRCGFLRPLEAGEAVTLAVTIPRLGNASIGYRVVGYGADGLPAFDADMAACHITEERGAPRPLPFPDELRARVAAYQRACEAPLAAARS